MNSFSFVPIGYGSANISNESEIVGGSPYGASYVMGSSGARGVSKSDKEVGEYQGSSPFPILSAVPAKFGSCSLTTIPSICSPPAGKTFGMTCNQFVKGQEVLNLEKKTA